MNSFGKQKNSFVKIPRLQNFVYNRNIGRRKIIGIQFMPVNPGDLSTP